MPDKLPISEFSAKIKAKYPQYKDVEDVELVNRIVEKYPQYREQVNFDDVGFQGEGSGNGSKNTSQTYTEPYVVSQSNENAQLSEQLLGKYPIQTKLTPSEEGRFQDWYSQVSEYKGLAPNPDDPHHFYDYRAFFKREPDMAQQMLTDDPNAHFTDIGKIAGHPTFSTESIYFNEETKPYAGEWENGVYIPFDKNRRAFDENSMTYIENPRNNLNKNNPISKLYPQGTQASEIPLVLTDKGREGYKGELRGYVDVQGSMDAFQELQRQKSELKDQITYKPTDTPEQRAERGNLAWEALKSVNNGFNQLASGLARLPAFIYNVAATPQNLVADMTGWESLRVGVDTDNAVTEFIQPYIDSHRQEMEAKYGTSVIDNFQEGDVSGGLRLLVNQVSESLPVMAAIGVTGGAVGASGAVLGGSFSANKYAEIQDNPEINDALKLTNALVTGYSELMLEQVGTGTILRTAENILKNTGREAAEEFTKRSFKEVYEGVMRRYFPITAPLAEGSEEMATQFVENVMDRITGVDPQRELSDGLMDSFVVGAAAGSAISTPVGVVNSISNKQRKREAENLVEENKAIQEVEPSTITEQEAQVLSDKYQENNERINDILAEERSEEGNLTPEQLAEERQTKQRIEAIDNLMAKETTPEPLKTTLEQEKSNLEDRLTREVSEETVQQTEEFSATEQADTVNTEGQVLETTDGTDTDVADMSVQVDQVTTTPDLTQIEEFTTEDVERVGNLLTNQELRQNRLTELRSNISTYWTNQQNLGISQDPVQNTQEFINFTKDLVEYAALSIADGTIRTAEQFRDFITNNGELNIDETITDKAFNDAQKSFVEASVAEQTVPATGTMRQQVRSATQGGIQGATTVSNRQALANQIRTFARGVREGINVQRETEAQSRDRVNEVKNTLTGYIDSFRNTDLFKGAKVPANLIPNLTKRLNSATSKKTVQGQINALYDFSEYLEKVVSDVEYDNKVRQARSNASKIDRIAKTSTFKKQSTTAPLVRELASLGKTPSRITNIDEYNAIAQDAVDSKGNIRVSNASIRDYLQREKRAQVEEASRRETELQEARKQRELDYIQSLLDEAGIDADANDFYSSDMTYQEGGGLLEESPVERDTLANQLVELIEVNRANLPESGSLEGYDGRMLEALRNQDLTRLSTADLRLFNAAINNAVINGDYVTNSPDIVGRYEARQEVQEWALKYDEDLERVRVGASNKWNTLAPNRNKVDTEQLIRNMFNTSKDTGRALYSRIMGDIDRGFVQAKRFIDENVSKAIDIYDKHKLKAQDSYDVGFAQFLLDFDTEGELTRQESFENRKSLIADAIEEITRNLETRADNLTRVERNRLKRDRDGMQLAFNRARQFPIVDSFQESFLNQGQRELYEHMLSTWEAKREQTREHFQKLGVKFSEIDLYFPISYNKIQVEDVDPSADLAIDSYHRAGAIDSDGKYVAERQDVRALPQRKTDVGTVVMYPSLDAIRTFDRELTRRMTDIETMDARVKAKHILADTELKSILDPRTPDGEGNISNHENLVWKVKSQIRDLNGMSGFVSDFNHNLDSFISYATRTFYRGAVGSWTQLANQSIPNIPAIMANTSVGAWTQSIRIMTTARMNGDNKVKKLMQSSNASALTRVDDSAEQRQQNLVSEIESQTEERLSTGIDKINERIGQLTYEGLKAGDNINTFNSWLSGYIHSLKEQGVIKKSNQFTSEMLEEHIQTPNKQAQEFADGIASSINATVRKASRAESTKNRSTAQRVLNAIMGNPLKSFATSQNMEARIAFRNLMSRRVTQRDANIILAYLANVVLLSNVVRYMWSVGFQTAGKTISGLLLGMDEEDDVREKAEERRLKDLGLTKEEESKVKVNRKVISMLANSAGAIMFGSSPIWLENLATSGIDLAYNKLVVSNFSEARTKKEMAREVLPQTLFYSSADNIFGAGVLDQFTNITLEVEKFATGSKPIDENAATKLQAVRFFNIVGQTGLLGADVKRLVQQTAIDMEKVVKDGYYKMSKSYGVIKDAVNEYGIKPLAPFNERLLYVEDEQGEVEQVALTDNDVEEINKAIGREMNNLLKDYGYGVNLKTFNKNDFTVDEINEDMKAIRRDALYNVILNRYGKYRTTKGQYNQQLEEGEE